MVYKYNELQISSVIQKLSYKASYKTLFFFIELAFATLDVFIWGRTM